jgi:uncharacterized protein (DUF2252 family)
MRGLDPMALARRQLDLDRARTHRFPHTLDRKIARMRASPLAFLRGSAPLFYELIAEDPGLRVGPPGEGWICGDAHLENFGAFVPEADIRGHGIDVVFDLNDFDECIVGPLRLDLLRLGTSLLLGARELGATGGQALEMVQELLDAWAIHVRSGRKLPADPRPVVALFGQVRSRSRGDLLNARTELKGGRRRFVRGPRYGKLPAEVVRGLPKAFAAYTETLRDDERPTLDQLAILDAAHRIAGTGSLGVLRVAVLVSGKGGTDGGWIFDLKEQPTPSTARVGRVPKGLSSAGRVAAAMRACLVAHPRAIGTTHLVGLSMFGRRLAPQEDRLDLTRIEGVDLPLVAQYLGALLGRAHRRGITRKPGAVTVASRKAVIERTIRLAGIHEAAYLAFCRLTG